VTKIRSNSQNTAQHKAQDTDTVDYILPRPSKKRQNVSHQPANLHVLTSTPPSWEHRYPSKYHIHQQSRWSYIIQRIYQTKQKKTASKQLAFDSQQAQTITSY